VRDAKSLLNEHFTGVYAGYIDLDASQCTRLKSTITKDPSHFERIKLSTGADVMVDESESVIKVTGKKSNVKKAKLSLLGVLEFMFPKQFQTVKVHKTLFKSMGEAEKLAEIAATTGASLYLDRDLISVVIRSESPDESSKALDLISARLVESEKLNYVFRLPASDAWLLPIIIGKGGSSVKKIETETGCTVDIFKDELTVVVRAESEEAVAIGKDVLEAMVDQARKECVFIDMPESAMPAFIGKGGANIKQLSSEYDVEIEKSKKNASKIQISGKEEAGRRLNL
jgi:transcription antitermination factor NusA-like protein